MSEIYTTPDIWLGAYLQSESDAELMDIQVSRGKRGTIMFVFVGENLLDKASEYCRDEAVANVSQLRERLNQLRDLIFQKKKRRVR